MFFPYFMMLALLQSFSICFSFSISSSPICTVYTPNSILEHKEQYKPLSVGNRPRYATCTGATWFHNSYLAVLNLYGQKLITYIFDNEQKKFNEIQEINNQDGTLPRKPENLTISPDGTLLAICSDGPKPGIKIYSINLETHLIDPKPILILPTTHLVHNVKFSPDGTYFASATFNKNESINIYQVSKHANNLTLNRTYKKKNEQKLMRVKALYFTKDSTYLVAAYSFGLHDSQNNPLENLLVSYPFNKESGTLDEPVCSIRGVN